MTNKLTNRKALAIAINVFRAELADDGEFIELDGQKYPLVEVISKLENMAASLDSKAANVNRKPTKTQLENAGFRDAIMAFLRANPNLIVTCTDLTKRVAELEGQTNQKVSALMRPLVDSGEVAKLTEKGKTFFQLAKPDVELEDNGDEG